MKTIFGRYVDLLAASLRQKLKVAEKMIGCQKLVSQKREEARNQALALQPTLKVIIQRTKELQTEVRSFKTFRKTNKDSSKELINNREFFTD